MIMMMHNCLSLFITTGLGNGKGIAEEGGVEQTCQRSITDRYLTLMSELFGVVQGSKGWRFRCVRQKMI